METPDVLCGARALNLIGFTQAVCCAQHNYRSVLYPKDDARPTCELCCRAPTAGTLLRAQSEGDQDTLRPHSSRVSAVRNRSLRLRSGSLVHNEHVVARNIVPVKTQRDDGVLPAVSPTAIPLERRRNMRPVKV